jgi:drug/metabolite transporter (DMT)-like permease
LSGFAKKDRPFLFADDEREQYHLYGKGNQDTGVPVVDDVVLTKNLLHAGFTPTQITPIRMALAYVALLVMRPRFLRLPLRDELIFVLIGIMGGSFYFFLQNTALNHTLAANVSILVSLSPIFTVILAQFFSRHNEKLGLFVYIGSLVAIAGVVLVVLNGSLNFHLNPLGDLLALAAGLAWAVYSILIKKYTEQYDNFIVTRRVMLWAFITGVPLMLLTGGMPDLRPLFTQTDALLSWLFLGILGNAVCFAIWNIAFQRLGVVVTNNYLYASPFVTMVVGWLLLDEKISLMGLIGAVLITAGVFLAQREKKTE